jgi:hypothetical protein
VAGGGHQVFPGEHRRAMSKRPLLH